MIISSNITKLSQLWQGGPLQKVMQMLVKRFELPFKRVAEHTLGVAVQLGFTH